MACPCWVRVECLRVPARSGDIAFRGHDTQFPIRSAVVVGRLGYGERIRMGNGDRKRIARFHRAPEGSRFSRRGDRPCHSPHNTPRRRPHGSINFRSFEAVNGARLARRLWRSRPLTASKLRKKEASMRSTALSAEGARARRRYSARLSRWRMRRRACLKAPHGNRHRQFLSAMRNSRYLESQARSPGYRRADHRRRDNAEDWRQSDSEF
jgi:hypothetical protein